MNSINVVFQKLTAIAVSAFHAKLSLAGFCSFLVPTGTFIFGIVSKLATSMVNVASFAFHAKVSLAGFCGFCYMGMKFFGNIVLAPVALVLALSKRIFLIPLWLQLTSVPPAQVLFLACQVFCTLVVFEYHHSSLGMATPPSGVFWLLVEILSPSTAVAVPEVAPPALSEDDLSMQTSMSIVEMDNFVREARLDKAANKALLMQVGAGASIIIAGLLAIIILNHR